MVRTEHQTIMNDMADGGTQPFHMHVSAQSRDGPYNLFHGLHTKCFMVFGMEL